MGLPAPHEADLVVACLQLLRARGVLAWRVNCGATKIGRRFVRFSSIDGVSDILGVLPGGRFLAVEAKLPGNRPTPHQQAFLAAVEASDGLALVVTDVAELAGVLDEPAAKDK